MVSNVLDIQIFEILKYKIRVLVKSVFNRSILNKIKVGNATSTTSVILTNVGLSLSV